jgi:hypothetical protein
MYPLTEPQRFAPQMRGELVEEIEAAKPEFIVFAGIPASWWIGKYEQPGGVVEWAKDYVRKG